MTTQREFLVGETIRFEAELRDWDVADSLIDPTVIKFFIKDMKFNPLVEIILTNQNRLEKGKYFYLYSPETPGFYYYEFWMSVDGLPSLDRGNFKVKTV